MSTWCLLLTVLILNLYGGAVSADEYYGKLIGSFTRRGDRQEEHHNVEGSVYAVDDDTLQIVGFSYDGLGPDAFFYIGTEGNPSANGFIIPKARGLGNEKLGSYNNVDLVIHLDTSVGPASISQYRWISVWCRMANANFADVFIDNSFTAPGEYSLGPLGFSPRVHGVRASDVIIVNSKQIRFEGLHYDGNGPDAYFWTDTRESPTSSGTRVPQLGESRATKLPRYNGVTITVQLPGSLTVFNTRNIGLWCVLARQNFGHLNFPTSLKSDGEIVPFIVAEDSVEYDNCMELSPDRFQVSWSVTGDEVTFRLSSREPFGNYMSFGLSGSDSETQMVGSDVAVAWVDIETSMARVEDYYLSARGQCVTNTGSGACPDVTNPTTGSDDVTLSGYHTEDAITHITYRRPLNATDSLLDKSILLTGPQYVSWALGPVNDVGLATFHEVWEQGNKQIDFSDTGLTCPAFTATTDSGGVEPFDVPEIKAMENTTFRCDIGQAGGRRGYQGITGSVGWGIAWYIDGNLIPEITVQRGQTYTFEVYGGNNPNQSASYHPFYITTDPAGGYAQLGEAARGNHEILAGPVEGSYCSYEDTASTGNPDDASSYSAYVDSLELTCPEGDNAPGTLVWTPDGSTPDTVYYQCYTHRFLGWKINVSDATKCTLSLVVMVMTLIITGLTM
ncbi:protein Skeletor, isoforms B/C-like [Diadema antillarum]|uniref:protein Skeletor, isoforms B/C-like n=1 Tax=Diadema antillarum TaxID=105358 RepID=UPI003A8A0B4A